MKQLTKSDHLLYIGFSIMLAVGMIVTFICPLMSVDKNKGIMVSLLGLFVIGFLVQITSWLLHHIRF